MSYEPTNWQTGDVVTADKLNKIENGVAGSSSGGTIVVTINNNGEMDKTWKEIFDALKLKSVSAVLSTEESVRQHPVYYAEADNDYYYIYAMNFSTGDTLTFETDSENGTPTFSEPT